MSSDLLAATTDPATQPSFSLSNRVKRSIWGFVYVLLFRPSPRPMHEWRSILLRLFGAKVGKGCHVYPKVTIWAPWNLEIGDLAGLGDSVNCYSMGRITIGEKAVISQGAHLCAGTHDYDDPSFRLLIKPIDVGPRCWICTEAFIGPGVVVGEGAVVGARAVVFKNIPPWTVWSGNPAKQMKDRKKPLDSDDAEVNRFEGL